MLSMPQRNEQHLLKRHVRIICWVEVDSSGCDNWVRDQTEGTQTEGTQNDLCAGHEVATR